MNGKRVFSMIFIFFYILIVLLIVLIAAGTIVALTRRSEKVNVKESGEEFSFVIRGGKALYGDIGQLRAVSSDEPSSAIVVYPFLEYDSADASFQEELVAKKVVLRNVIIGWFAKKKVYTILSMTESEIKKALLDGINSELNLGKISGIYFKEFKVIN